MNTTKLVHEIISTWRTGATVPDALKVLRDHPELVREKELCLDLVYEEFCLRNELGERIQPSVFCGRFPDYHHSIRRMLDVHSVLNSQGLDDLIDLNAAMQAGDAEFFADTWPEFELVSELGRGAFAEVYLCRQRNLGQRLVAVKFTRAGDTEADLLGRLAHPSIVPVHSIHHDPESLWTAICMEYVGRATLVDLLDAAFSKSQEAMIPTSNEAWIQVVQAGRQKDREHNPFLDSTSLPHREYVAQVVEIACQLLEGLVHAHQLGIQHRDLKPSNVLLGHDGRARLLDFNLSNDEERQDGALGGTLPYMSPEQIQAVFLREAVRLDARTDIFSFAVVIYQLLCGKLPFGEAWSIDHTIGSARKRLGELQAELVPVRQWNPNVPRELCQLVAECLQWNAENRPPDCQSVLKAMQGMSGTSAPRKRSVTGMRWTPIAGGSGLLALTVAGAWALGWNLPLGDFTADRGSVADQSDANALTMQPLTFPMALNTMRAGQPRVAQRQFQQLVAQEPNLHWQLYAGLAESCLRLKSFAEAAEAFEAAFEVSQDHDAAQSRLLAEWVIYSHAMDRNYQRAIEFARPLMRHRDYVLNPVVNLEVCRLLTGAGQPLDTNRLIMACRSTPTDPLPYYWHWQVCEHNLSLEAVDPGGFATAHRQSLEDAGFDAAQTAYLLLQQSGWEAARTLDPHRPDRSHFDAMLSRVNARHRHGSLLLTHVYHRMASAQNPHAKNDLLLALERGEVWWDTPASLEYGTVSTRLAGP